MLTVGNPFAALASAFTNRLPVPQSNGDGVEAAGSFWMRPGADKLNQLEAYNQVSTLHQVVHSLSEDTSRVEWHMHRKRQRSSVRTSQCELCGKENVDLLEDHPALTRWNEPNDFLVGQEFREGYQQHVELTGEGYWIIDILDAGDFGGPMEMWYARPDRMLPIKSKQKFLAGWVYRSPEGELVPLEIRQVIPIKSPDPVDIYAGSAATASLLIDIRSSVRSALWTDKFFENSAMPGGIIEVPNIIEDPQFEKLLLRWREQHKGVTNAHRVAILEAGMQWKDRSFSPKDMILTDLRKFSNDQIRQAWGFPEFASGMLQNANRASSEASDAWYTQRLIVPRLDKTRDALNYRYLKLWGTTGRAVEFAYSDPVPPDAESVNAERDSKVNAWASLVNAGADPDDAARVVGLPPMRVVARPNPVPNPNDAGA